MSKIPVYLLAAAIVLIMAMPAGAFVMSLEPDEIITAQSHGAPTPGGMRATASGWSNPVPVRYVTPPGGPVGPYAPNGPYYGPNAYYDYWIPLGVSNTSNFPTFDTNPVRVSPPSTPPKPPDPKTQAADTVNHFMSALKYSDMSTANSLVPVSMQSRSGSSNASGYISQRVGKIYQWKIQDVHNVSGTTYVVTALITLSADMNYAQEQKSFTVSQGKIVDPF